MLGSVVNKQTNNRPEGLWFSSGWPKAGLRGGGAMIFISVDQRNLLVVIYDLG